MHLAEYLAGVIWALKTRFFFFYQFQEDIEKIVKDIEAEEKKKSKVVEKVVSEPTRRANFSFLPHPDKDQLILFGGEFYDGQKVSFFYSK